MVKDFINQIIIETIISVIKRLSLFLLAKWPVGRFYVRKDIIKQADQYEKIGRKFLMKAEELRKKADEEDLD